MTKLETRLKENGYVFEKEQRMAIGLRSYLVKLYVKIEYNATVKKVYISNEDIITSHNVNKKELNKLNGYN